MSLIGQAWMALPILGCAALLWHDAERGTRVPRSAPSAVAPISATPESPDSSPRQRPQAAVPPPVRPGSNPPRLPASAALAVTLTSASQAALPVGAQARAAYASHDLWASLPDISPKIALAAYDMLPAPDMAIGFVESEDGLLRLDAPGVDVDTAVYWVSESRGLLCTGSTCALSRNDRPARAVIVSAGRLRASAVIDAVYTAQ